MKLQGKIMKKNDWQILFLAVMGVVFLVIFAYVPMFGVLLAFKNGDNQLNIMNVLINGEWVGFSNFKKVFLDWNFSKILLNTLGLNLLMLVISFPASIIFALFINEIHHPKYRVFVHSVSIFPNFLSWIVFGGIMIALSDMTTGVVNPLLEVLGLSSPKNPVNLMSAEYFWTMMIISSLIKGTGWGSIVYTAALSRVDKEMYEAAEIDGATRMQKMFYISLPSIAPTITVFLLLSISNLLNNNFEQIYTFQNAINLTKSEVLATYIYKLGVSQNRYSFTTALGLMQSLVSIILLGLGNFISKKTAGSGIF